jgi:hypothetical protein
LEQKTINQNKLLTLLCIIALTLGVLVSAVLFSMPPVHAEEVTDTPLTMVVTTEIDDSWNNRYGTITYTIENNIDLNFYDVCAYYDTGKAYGTDIDTRTISFIWKRKSDNVISFSNDSVKIISVDATGSTVPQYSLNSTTQTLTSDQSRYDDGINKGFYSYYTFVSGNYPIAESYKDAENYLLIGDKSGLITPEAPNLTDDTYTFTGFTMNGKTARWTGTTERSFAKEVDVEEYVKVSYAWATTTEPDKFGELRPYDGEFATSDKQLTLPWSEMEKGKTDFQFIRQVKIFPCYRVPHLAYYIGQPVTIYYNSDGTVDKIEQTTIPSDSETIGNNISLIGFRYDNSFHAEWVDVWSNGANKSAFDLSGSQYLSLGVKAVYYDGSKADIDFYSLDRKNLTWNKKLSDFKENNGSPIKSLYFTPYTKTGVNNPWNKGNSTVVNFDENGNASSSFDTGDDGTVHLDDFKLTGVVWNKPVVKNGTITWTGTTPNSDLLFVPDSDTLVTATYPRYDADLNTSYETWSTTTIGKGSMKVNVDYLIDYYKNSELAWNGEMWLTPCYKKGGVLYVGDPVIINCLKGTVSDIVVDKDSGKAEQVDKTDQNKSDADSILNVGNQFYSIINGLIGSLQQLPALLTAIFGFLPSSIINLLYASFAVIIICRILGR